MAEDTPDEPTARLDWGVTSFRRSLQMLLIPMILGRPDTLLECYRGTWKTVEENAWMQQLKNAVIQFTEDQRQKAREERKESWKS